MSLAAELLFPDIACPAPARLTRHNLRDLIRLCEIEVGRCGLDQEAGRRAQELRAKLLDLHRLGIRANSLNA